MNYKVGDIVDIKVSKKAKEMFYKFQHHYELRIEANPKTHLSNLSDHELLPAFAKVIKTFGPIIRVEIYYYHSGRVEEDIHSRFLQLNTKIHREKRLKKLLK